MSLGNEETNPDSASFDLPTPGHTPPSTEIRANTVLLNGGQPPPAQYGYGGRDHDTIPDTKERRKIALGLGAVVLILCLGAAVALLNASLSGPEKPTNAGPSDNVKMILGTKPDKPKKGDEVADAKKQAAAEKTLPDQKEQPAEEEKKDEDESSPEPDDKSPEEPKGDDKTPKVEGKDEPKPKPPPPKKPPAKRDKQPNVPRLGTD